jgi:tetratricopeptide (TPR) repeat protein
MGNGAQVRTLYRDSTLRSYFLSEFSESTAAAHPCRFFSWDGQRFALLYAPGTDLFFQVGSDLLVLGRTAGARHAFRRGLLAGEDPIDHYYWLGWSEFWLSRRAAAEESWSRFGARDDSLSWMIRMRLARMALIDRRDSLEARRQLLAAIRAGIGRPEAHAVLGPLLMDRRPKYGLLELQVAISLKPDDWLARRDLVLGLTQQQLDGRARSELAELEQVYPGWQQDSLLSRARAELDRREQESRTVIRF